MTIARGLAERSHAIRFEDLSQEAVRWAKAVTLDTIGVTLAGAPEDCTQIVRRVATASGVQGPSLLLGTGWRVPVLEAALVNGTAAHALDYDCTSTTMGGHPAVHLVPALYALGEQMEVNGKTFMAALTAGMATEIAIARGAQPLHFLDGWFGTSSIGVFGAAAGASRLLGLGIEQTAQALGVASMLASGVIGNAGTMTKPLGAGHSARSGLLAALLAQGGFTSAPDAIENRRGFLMLFNGPGRYDERAIATGSFDPLHVFKDGLSIKQYPCCGIVQAHIDVLRQIVAEHRLGPDDVQRVDALIHPQRIRHVDRPDPQNNIEAKFSAYYCLALTLVKQCPTLEDFEGTRYNDTAIRRLMARIHVAPDPEGESSAEELGEQFGADVRVTTTDGRSFHARVDEPVGRGKTPLPRALLDAKFLNCAGRVLEPTEASKLLDLLWRFDEVENLRTVSAAMVPLASAGRKK
jgi:2-methylcitrate dehydratase PrpD